MNVMNNQISFRIVTVICVLLTVMYTSCLYAQGTERRVSGTITDPSGRRVIGGTVTVKGTTRGTVSDIDGKYAVMVPEGAILQFSYLGLESREIAVENRSVIDIVMEEGDLMKGIEPAKPVNLTGRQREKANADNELGFKMFREVSKLQGANTFFSPFSLNQVIGILYNGSSGNTRMEIAKMINVSNLPESEFNEYYRTISQQLLKVDPTTEIAITNAIWYRNNFQVKEAFIGTGKKYFDADIEAIDFNDPKATGIINNWCRDKTRGRINNIAVNPYGADMILTNAIYFKSKWQRDKKFDKEKTKPDDFTKSDNIKRRVNMMEQTTNLPYYADQYLQCVEMPYGNEAFSMIAILPPENGSIDQLIDHLGNMKWDLVVNEMEEERVWLKMPRFRIECQLPLNQPLTNAGMGSIFKGGFANMADTDMSVSNILQKTFVEVNEEGTEAAAATAMMIVGFGTMKALSEPVRFFADRPFLFLIREKSTGVILFIGRIDVPPPDMH